jgi:hypothetical protein
VAALDSHLSSPRAPGDSIRVPRCGAKCPGGSLCQMASLDSLVTAAPPPVKAWNPWHTQGSSVLLGRRLPTFRSRRGSRPAFVLMFHSGFLGLPGQPRVPKYPDQPELARTMKCKETRGWPGLKLCEKWDGWPPNPRSKCQFSQQFHLLVSADAPKDALQRVGC